MERQLKILADKISDFFRRPRRQKWPKVERLQGVLRRQGSVRRGCERQKTWQAQSKKSWKLPWWNKYLILVL